MRRVFSSSAAALAAAAFLGGSPPATAMPFTSFTGQWSNGSAACAQALSSPSSSAEPTFSDWDIDDFVGPFETGATVVILKIELTIQIDDGPPQTFIIDPRQYECDIDSPPPWSLFEPRCCDSIW